MCSSATERSHSHPRTWISCLYLWKKKVLGLKKWWGEGSSVLVSVLPSNAEPNTILKQTSNLLLNPKSTLFNCSFIDLSMRGTRVRSTCPGPLVLVAILWAFASPMRVFPVCPLAVAEAWFSHWEWLSGPLPVAGQSNQGRDGAWAWVLWDSSSIHRVVTIGYTSFW